MRKKIGLSIVALTAVTAFAFCGVACSKKNNDDSGDSYTVTFDANGGMFAGGSSTATKSVEKGGYVSGEQTPTRDNFIFYGWLKDENDIVTVNLSTTVINGDTTFYAGWKQAVDITYYYNYSGAPNGGVYMTDTIASGSLLTEPADPTRTGFTFDCWTTDAAGDNVWAFATDKAMNKIDLYAQWLDGNHGGGDEQSEYTVTLHVGEQTTGHTVTENSLFSRPTDPELSGYRFVEWRLGSINGEAYDFDTLVNADIELYAYFEADNAVYHNIAYVLDDGVSTVAVNNASNANRYAEGKTLTLEEPTRPAYTFEGWYSDAEFDNKVTTVGESETSDITLYAKWSYDYPFFVTGSDNAWRGYDELKAKPNDDEEKVSHSLVPYIVGEGDTRTWDGKTYIAERVYLTQGVGNIGYKIVSSTKWYGANGSSDSSAENLRANDGTGYYTIKIVASSNDAATISITPTLHKFNVSFVTGNDDIVIESVLYKEGGHITEPTVKGYHIDKWYSDEAKTIEWNFDDDTVTADMTLYAGEIIANKVKVEYVACNHLTWTAAETTEVDYGSMLDLSYILETGYTDSVVIVKVNGNAVTDGFKVNTESKIKIVAEGEIKKNKYTVIFNEADGTKISEVTVEHGDDVTAPTPQTITGKRFTGWSSPITNVTESKTVTAEYEFIEYTVTFHTNGGTDVSEATLHYGDKITEPTDVTKTDMLLVGWYTDSKFTEGTEWDFENDVIDGDVELYAKWEKDESSVQWYTISFKRNKSDAEPYNSTEVSENSTVAKPASPKLTGYVFDKWFDEATDAEYVFGSNPTGDITLYATWSLKAPTVTVNNISGAYKADGYTLTATPSHELSGVTYSYKWYKGVTLIPSATNATYIVSSVADSGEYTVEVTATMGELTATATAISTVAISKMSLPAISGIAFKDGDAYSLAVMFNANDTTAAASYELNIYDSEGVRVYTKQINTNGANEFALDCALTGEYAVKITYAGLVSAANTDNTEAQAMLNFKGKGTAECPFIVSTVDDIKRIADHQNAHFVQSVNIDIPSSSKISALFTSDNQFGGVYDGSGFTVRGITDGRGLFGYIGMGAIVKDLTVSVKLSSGTIDYMGGVAAVNGGTIQNVTVMGSITSTRGTVNADTDKTKYGTGGIVGKNSGTVDGCINNASLMGKISVGGIVGINESGATVKNSQNTALIGTNNYSNNVASGSISWAGGLVGYNSGTVSRSVNDGNVTANKDNGTGGNGNNYLSGLVAENAVGGTITECVNNGKIYGDYAPAGLVSKNNSTVEYCVNTGNVEARWTVSGGTCFDDGTITNCIMTGTVTATGGGDKTAVSHSGTASYCYYINGTAPNGKNDIGNGKYSVSTINKVVEMLTALGEKFVYDGTNITLSMLVDAQTVVVQFVVNGDAYITLNTVAGITIDMSGITQPTLDNHTFAGWYVASDSEQTIVEQYEITTDVSFVAQFNKNQYTITFDADGGSAVAEITDDYDKALTAPTSTKTGYTLVGWFEDGSETSFDFTAERSGNVSLRAKWQANEYTITFETNGGTLAQTTKQVVFDGKYGELPTPTRSGYKFIGWYSQNGSEGTDEGWGFVITANTSFTTDGNITVYAKWEEVSQTVILDYNYDGCPAAHEIGVSENDSTIAINVINRVGYTLKGFATEADGEVVYVASITKAQFDELRGEGTEVTLYAVWEAIEYTLTVDLNGGAMGDTTTEIKFTIEDCDGDGNYDLSKLVLTRDCRAFNGWTVTRDGKAEQNVTLSDGYTITAKWAAPVHTEKTLEAKDATCTETGLTEGVVCEICGEVLVEQEVVAKVPHSYEDGECTVCGQAELALTVEDDATGDGYIVTGVAGEITFENLVIPSDYDGKPVTGIAEEAFADEKYYVLISLTVPDSVTSIGGKAFAGCTNLQILTVPFLGPDSNGGLIGYFFSGNNSSYSTSNSKVPSTLKTVVINGGKMVTQAFRGTSIPVENVVIPKSVTELPTRAFQNSALKNVYYAGTAEEWSKVTIGTNNTNLNNNTATVYYYSETAPTGEGNYWHYVDGVPTAW